MKDEDAKNIELAVDERAMDIEQLNLKTVGSTVGVAQAIDKLKTSLDAIGACLDERSFREASSLGYKDVASDFIFLQRALAGLHNVSDDTDVLIQDIALKTTGVFEDVAPFVLRRIESLDK